MNVKRTAQFSWLSPSLSALIFATVVVFQFMGCAREESSNPIHEAVAQEDSALEPGVPARTKKAYFDKYVLKAVEYLYANYKMLGYDLNSLYTHDLPYGEYGLLTGTPGPKTMCVAAQIEVILTALDLYAKDTGKKSVFDFLPLRSWKSLTVNDIKGHIWVNSDFDSYGTADALSKFGMGELVPFEKLTPGSFLNYSRTTKSGHAVVFLAFIDKDGKEYTTHNSSVIGFKYFSAQGVKDPATAGFDYRYAIFSKHGCPEMPYKRDCDIIYSTSRKGLNAGRMWAPTSWVRKTPSILTTSTGEPLPESRFDAEFFTGETTDDAVQF